MEPLISFIISVYNTEMYISQCLDAVIAQTYQHWELIVVDDGSTDRSAQICDEYAARDKRIRAIHKQNTGQSDSRNKALQMVQGEFVAFIDSDDWIDPHFCETLLKAIRQTGKDCATCSYLNEFADGSESDPVCHEQHTLTSSQAIAAIYDRRMYGFIHGRLYHRSLLVEPIPQLSRYEDFAVIFRWLSHGNGMVLCPDFLYHYRQRKSSIMNREDDFLFGYAPLLEECYHLVQDKELMPLKQNQRIAVRNCIRIAKDVARKSKGAQTMERLETIRHIMERLQPIAPSTVGMQCYCRMRLLMLSPRLFRQLMSLSYLMVRERKREQRTYFN